MRYQFSNYEYSPAQIDYAVQWAKRSVLIKTTYDENGRVSKQLFSQRYEPDTFNPWTDQRKL